MAVMDSNVEVRLYCDEVDSARDELFELCQNQLNKLSSNLGSGYVAVHIKKNKEVFRGLHERECHMSVNTTSCKQSLHAREFGAPESVRSAFLKLKTVVMKGKEEKVAAKKTVKGRKE